MYELLIKNVLYDRVEFLDEESLRKAIEMLKKETPKSVVTFLDECEELITIISQPSADGLQPETKDGIVLVEAYINHEQIWKSF